MIVGVETDGTDVVEAGSIKSGPEVIGSMNNKNRHIRQSCDERDEILCVSQLHCTTTFFRPPEAQT